MELDKQDKIIQAFNLGYYSCKKSGKVFSFLSKGPIELSGGGRPTEMSGTPDKDGYVRVYTRFCKDSKPLNSSKHRLIWIYFNGKIPDGMQINHKNGIKTDNRLCNLEVVTPYENIKHSIEKGLRCSPKGHKHCHAKLTEKEAEEIKYSSDRTSFLAHKYNISLPTVCGIRSGRTWKHI